MPDYKMIVYRVRRHPIGGTVVPGDDVHMSDGSVWFHPYNGWPPFKV